MHPDVANTGGNIDNEDVKPNFALSGDKKNS
jgi:hypothetical protein